MIHVTGKKMVRQTTAPYEYANEKGELATDDIVVRYFDQNAGEKREYVEKMRQLAEKDPGKIICTAEILATRLESLPDLRGPDGKDFAITVENLELLSAANLTAINAAIIEDESPKSKPGA